MRATQGGILASMLSAVQAYNFAPANVTATSDLSNSLPIPYNLSQSLTNQTNTTGTSYWSSSFLTGTNNHTYLLVSHTMGGLSFAGGFPSLYRASLLDITDPNNYAMFSTFSNITSLYSPASTLPSDIEVFNASFPDFGFGVTSTTTDPLSSPLRTWSGGDNAVQFDITFELSSPVLLNGGLGVFEASGVEVHEWSMPAGYTTGWILVDGTRVDVVPENSRTWWDRQFGGSPPTWTWFELHLQGAAGETTGGGSGNDDVYMSVWVWEDSVRGNRQFGTVRGPDGVQRVVPVVEMKTGERTWTSSVTNLTYALDWTLSLLDGTVLTISSVREDQEISGIGGAFATYEGFLNVSGVYQGSDKAQGFGLVEMFFQAV